MIFIHKILILQVPLITVPIVSLVKFIIHAMSKVASYFFLRSKRKLSLSR
jgi:hypothetical protein